MARMRLAGPGGLCCLPERGVEWSRQTDQATQHQVPHTLRLVVHVEDQTGQQLGHRPRLAGPGTVVEVGPDTADRLLPAPAVRVVWGDSVADHKYWV